MGSKTILSVLIIAINLHLTLALPGWLGKQDHRGDVCNSGTYGSYKALIHDHAPAQQYCAAHYPVHCTSKQKRMNWGGWNMPTFNRGPPQGNGASWVPGRPPSTPWDRPSMPDRPPSTPWRGWSDSNPYQNGPSRMPPKPQSIPGGRPNGWTDSNPHQNGPAKMLPKPPSGPEGRPKGWTDQNADPKAAAWRSCLSQPMPFVSAICSCIQTAKPCTSTTTRTASPTSLSSSASPVSTTTTSVASTVSDEQTCCGETQLTRVDDFDHNFQHSVYSKLPPNMSLVPKL